MSIVVEGLTHIFSKGKPNEEVALNQLNMEIRPGEFVGIIGPTGSGKSTLIKHFNGLLLPTSGRVQVCGMDTKGRQLSEIRRRAGMVFQHPENQLFEGTVYEDMAFGLRNYGMNEEEIRGRVYKTARELNLREELLRKSPFDLSGGEKRMVAIAGILAVEPEILVLDEPAAGLDAFSRKKVYELVKERHQSRGTTIVLVTHRMEEIVELAQRLIFLQKGRVQVDAKTPLALEWMANSPEHRARLPKIAHLMNELKERVPSLNDAVYTVGAAKEEILRHLPREVPSSNRLI